MVNAADSLSPTLQSGIQLLDAVSGVAVPSAPTGGVLARSTLPWRGVQVEHHRLAPMEMAGHHLMGHRMVINIGQTVPFEWQKGARWNATTYQPGCFSLQSNGDFHAPRWHQTFDFLSLALEPEFVRDMAGEAEVEFEEQRGELDAVITQFAHHFHHSLYTPFSGSPLFADSMATAFTFHLLEKYSVNRKKLSGTRGRLEGHQLRTVVAYAYDNLDQPLTIEDLAAQVFLSPFHFSRRFKAATRLSPHQFLLQIRIDKAKRLMKTHRNPLNLTHIALATGFYDQSHFIHAFKRGTGYTPKAFLAQC